MSSGPHLSNWLDLQDDAERPFTRFDGEVPGADLDIAAALAARVTPPPGSRESGAFDDFGVKARNLARAFAGAPELHLINAKLIVLLRRRDPPDHAPALYQRIWAEAHEALAAGLDARWLISSVDTLASFGATPAQRQSCTGLSVLCKTVKLYETERLFSGTAPADLHPGPRHKAATVALGQTPFAIKGGDLDRTLITGIWRQAEADPAAAALAARLIPALLRDEGAIFRRLRRMRGPAPE